MADREPPRASNRSPQQAPSSDRDAVLWALAVAGFVLAMVFSYRTARAPQSFDLRTPAVLLLDAVLATAVSLAYAAQQGALSQRGLMAWPFLYGLWSAAVFRLVPPVFTTALFYERVGSSIRPGSILIVLTGAAIHGGITMLAAWPYARRALGMETRPLWAEGPAIPQVAVVTVIVFFVVAAIARLIASFSM